MREEEFIGQVQARAGFGSRGPAESATRATLETLAERVQSPQAENLAAQLPREIGEHLRRVVYAPDEPVTGARMSTQEFFDRVAGRAGLDPPKAAHAARCVVEVMGEATQGNIVEKIKGSLDDDLSGVLFAGSTGKAGP
ncbi:hypothetical protein GCM10018793_20230 [Streptomyces sulfonofaciens]|uniref:DUF2267 domain-containing protein n=1 Tax=Streptomyces sulfonofaciens TaxID=68272 RepID=A0A919G099_9ACTN|nr:DUF2267 domain-containing protein [Streptomyces sulfonofaciens]GHH75802.1 hypothetical protein GCM10018793_20230 [Streptomyces sulfonofaciens]